VCVCVCVLSLKSIQSSIQNFLQNLIVLHILSDTECPLDNVWPTQTMSGQASPGVFKPLNHCLSHKFSLSPWTKSGRRLPFPNLFSSDRWLLERVRFHPRVLLLRGNSLPHLLHTFVFLRAFKVKISFFYLISQCT
jgi:hypothetical protein